MATLGISEVLSAQTSIGSGDGRVFGPFVPDFTGEIDNINTYVESIVGTPGLILSIYDSNGEQVTSGCGTVATATAAAWNTFSFTTKPTVSGGQDYYLAVGILGTPGVDSAAIAAETSSLSNDFYDNQWAATCPTPDLDTLTLTLTQDSSLSLSAEYTRTGDLSMGETNIAQMHVDATSPATDGVAIDVAAADQTFDQPVRAIYVGTSGDIKLDTHLGTTLTFTAVPAGIFPVGALKIYQTGTSAAAMVGLY